MRSLLASLSSQVIGGDTLLLQDAIVSGLGLLSHHMHLSDVTCFFFSLRSFRKPKDISFLGCSLIFKILSLRALIDLARHNNNKIVKFIIKYTNL